MSAGKPEDAIAVQDPSPGPGRSVLLTASSYPPLRTLRELEERVSMDKGPVKVTVRELLALFGYQRRGTTVISVVEDELSKQGLAVSPHLSEPYIDGEIQIDRKGSAVPAHDYDKMIARLAHLDAANQVPVSVKRDQELGVAQFAMLRHSYSQLPVMPNEYKVEGFISWTTIGEARAVGKAPEYVRDCINQGVRTLDARTPLTDAIEEITRFEFVMVKGEGGQIRGPVTTTDLSQQYHALALPFLLLGQIEASIRTVLHLYAPIPVLQAARRSNDDREIKGPEDLAFSEYKAALGHEAVWSRLGLALPKPDVMKLLEEVREIRNDVMHFRPDDGDFTVVSRLQAAAHTFDQIAVAVAGRRAAADRR